MDPDLVPDSRSVHDRYDEQSNTAARFVEKLIDPPDCCRQVADHLRCFKYLEGGDDRWSVDVEPALPKYEWRKNLVMLIIELSMNPLGKNESVSQDVAKIIDIIDHSGLNYKLGPMGTCIEGEWDDVIGVVKKCFVELQSGCNRLTFSIKGDWRTGDKSRMDSKIESIERELGREVYT